MMQISFTIGLEFAAVNMVAKEITTDWKMLGRFLGLEQCAIEEIDRYGYAKYKEKAHHVLRKWQKRSGENATKEVLIEALEDVQRKDIADDLRNMWIAVKLVLFCQSSAHKYKTHIDVIQQWLYIRCPFYKFNPNLYVIIRLVNWNY